MRICPKCGGKQFVTTGHVVQKWLVDECGLCTNVLDDCICVTYYPDNQNVWTCFSCGYEAAGQEFWVDEEKIE